MFTSVLVLLHTLISAEDFHSPQVADANHNLFVSSSFTDISKEPALQNTKVNLTVDRCNFLNCISPTNGGGIFHDNSSTSLTITNSNFSKCASGQSAGAIYAFCSHFNLENLTIYDCAALSNQFLTVTHSGGAYLSATSGKSTITSVHFCNCTAPIGGGCVVWSDDTVEVLKCLIENCTANHDGAGIFIGNVKMLDNTKSQDTGKCISDYLGTTQDYFGAGLHCITSSYLTEWFLAYMKDIPDDFIGGFITSFLSAPFRKHSKQYLMNKRKDYLGAFVSYILHTDFTTRYFAYEGEHPHILLKSILNMIFKDEFMELLSPMFNFDLMSLTDNFISDFASQQLVGSYLPELDKTHNHILASLKPFLTDEVYTVISTHLSTYNNDYYGAVLKLFAEKHLDFLREAVSQNKITLSTFKPIMNEFGQKLTDAIESKNEEQIFTLLLAERTVDIIHKFMSGTLEGFHELAESIASKPFIALFDSVILSYAKKDYTDTLRYLVSPQHYENIVQKMEKVKERDLRTVALYVLQEFTNPLLHETPNLFIFFFRSAFYSTIENYVFSLKPDLTDQQRQNLRNILHHNLIPFFGSAYLEDYLNLFLTFGEVLLQPAGEDPFIYRSILTEAYTYFIHLLEGGFNPVLVIVACFGTEEFRKVLGDLVGLNMLKNGDAPQYQAIPLSLVILQYWTGISYDTVFNKLFSAGLAKLIANDDPSQFLTDLNSAFDAQDRYTAFTACIFSQEYVQKVLAEKDKGFIHSAFSGILVGDAKNYYTKYLQDNNACYVTALLSSLLRTDILFVFRDILAFDYPSLFKNMFKYCFDQQILSTIQAYLKDHPGDFILAFLKPFLKENYYTSYDRLKADSNVLMPSVSAFIDFVKVVDEKKQISEALGYSLSLAMEQVLTQYSRTNAAPTTKISISHTAFADNKVIGQVKKSGVDVSIPQADNDEKEAPVINVTFDKTYTNGDASTSFKNANEKEPITPIQHSDQPAEDSGSGMHRRGESPAPPKTPSGPSKKVLIIIIVSSSVALVVVVVLVIVLSCIFCRKKTKGETYKSMDGNYAAAKFSEAAY